MKKYIQEHKYVLLVLYLPIYLIWFALVERMVPSTEGCFVSYLPLDDKIPFLPGFILAYVLWYPFLIVPVVVTLLKDDRRAFIRYAAFIIAGFSISLTIWHDLAELPAPAPVRGGHEHAVRLAGQCDLFGRHADECPAEYARGRLYGRAGRDVRQ